MKRLDLELFAGHASAAPGDTAVVPIPRNERPLRGDAGELDWRLRAEISQEILQGRVEGSLHEAVLIPGRPPAGVARVMLVGVGASDSLPGRPLQDVFRRIAQRLIALRSERAVLALPGSIDLAVDADAVLRGCLQVISSTRGSARLALVIPRAQRLERPLLGAIGELAPEAERRGVALGLEWTLPSPEQLTPEVA